GISILPDNKAMISLYGYQWNLKNKEIFSGNTLTLSNFTVKEGCVVVKDGLVIVIIEPLSSKNGK
ncbi:MAG: hypothetical protein Q4Q17_05235, partial [Tissierellia bacterium]|nr:hypothetical protein [Tissierellia bacterium]